jgi:hypothetical protein
MLFVSLGLTRSLPSARHRRVISSSPTLSSFVKTRGPLFGSAPLNLTGGPLLVLGARRPATFFSTLPAPGVDSPAAFIPWRRPASPFSLPASEAFQAQDYFIKMSKLLPKVRDHFSRVHFVSINEHCDMLVACSLLVLCAAQPNAIGLVKFLKFLACLCKMGQSFGGFTAQR